jgi:HTH-type transcriptional regulator/antitoxin HigA
MPAASDSKAVPADDVYLGLVREFPLRPLRSDSQLMRAIAMVDRLVKRDGLSPGEADYLAVLTDLVEAYEDEHEPDPELSPAEMLRALIEAKGVTQAKVAAETGVSESTISAILTGKRRVSHDARVRLGNYFAVQPQAFA